MSGSVDEAGGRQPVGTVGVRRVGFAALALAGGAVAALVAARLGARPGHLAAATAVGLAAIAGIGKRAAP